MPVCSLRWQTGPANLAPASWRSTLGPPNQLFIAPGSDDEPLPIEPSAWHAGRCVVIPLEHWEIILQFVAGTDKALFQTLERYSYPPDTRRILPADDELRVVLHSLDELQDRIRASPPFVPVVNERFPEDFSNEEHALMVKAAAAVFREALTRGEPFEGDLDT